MFLLQCKIFSISKFFPVNRERKEDAVKLALEKLRSAVADVAGIAKYTFKFFFFAVPIIQNKLAFWIRIFSDSKF